MYKAAALIVGQVLKDVLFTSPQRSAELSALNQMRAYLKGADYARKGIKILLGGVLLINLSIMGVTLSCIGAAFSLSEPLRTQGIAVLATGLVLLLLSGLGMLIFTSERLWVKSMKVDEFLCLFDEHNK